MTRQEIIELWHTSVLVLFLMLVGTAMIADDKPAGVISIMLGVVFATAFRFRMENSR